MFTRYHLGYSFPGRTTPLECFPDRFWVWSQFWKDLMPLPIPEESVVVHGFAHLERSKVKYAGVKQNDRQILVLSQGTVGPEMARTIYNHRERLRNFQIVYKLHPGEYDRWQQYEGLRKMIEQPNFKLVTGADLYHLIGRVAEEGYDTTVYRVSLHDKLAFPLVCLLMGLIGAGIGLSGRSRGGGMSASIAYGLGASFLYYIIYSFSLSLGHGGMLPPIVAAWTANVVFAGVAAVLVWKIE